MGKNKEFKALLKGMDKAFRKSKEAAEKPSEYELNIDNGKYEAAITGIECAKSGAGNPMVVVEYTVSEGDFEGTTLKDFLVLNNDIGRERLCRFVSKMEYEMPEDPTDLPDLMDQIMEEKPNVKIKVAVKDDADGNPRARIIFLELLGGDSSDSKDSKDSEEDDEKETKKSKKEKDDETDSEESDSKDSEDSEEDDEESKDSEDSEKNDEADSKDSSDSEDSEEADEDDEKTELLNFCDSNDVEYEKDASVKDLQKAIKKVGKFKEEDLSKSEIKLCKKLGVKVK